MGTQLPLPQRAQPPIFGPYLLWPNGWMDQDAAWYGGRHRPRLHCVRREPSSPSPKGHSPQFSTNVCCGLTAATVQGSRLRPWPHCVRWGPSSLSPKGAQPPSLQIFCHVCCGQMAGWIKMQLHTGVGIGPGYSVLDGNPALPPPTGTAPNFRPMSVVAKWLDGSRCSLVRR